jgi:spore photoproduct lyase
MRNIEFDSYSIESSQVDTIAGKTIKKAVPELEVIEAESKQTSDYIKGKKSLHIKEKRGNSISLCASLSEKYICCNVHVLNTVSNCPFNCTYCFLQNYLTNKTVSIIGNIDTVLDEVTEKINKEPKRFFRIGTWELGDSLALEQYTGQAKTLIKGFAKFNNALLDLRTKSDNVDSILGLEHKGKTVVSWSLNPQVVIAHEEKDTASLSKRLIAMKKVTAAGYLTSIHFDPIILYKGWETGYISLIKQIFDTISADKVAWISIGSLRFNPEMKKIMEQNFPESKITAEEMVLGNDGKMRYVKPVRLEMYKLIYDAIRKYGGNDILVHLCMERWDVWEKIFGECPDSTEELDFRFAASLYDRFSQFRFVYPERKYFN